MNTTLIDQLDPRELGRGFFFDAEGQRYRCLFCASIFEEGRIYPDQESLVTAEKAAVQHVDRVHDGAFTALLGAGKPTTGLSDTQAELLGRLGSGVSDRRIAEALQISVSTVRNHRFQLRRRAREAKVVLALMNLLESSAGRDRDLLELPAHLTVSDERTQITVSEAEEVRKKYLEYEPTLRLKRFPKKEKLKLILLLEIINQFEAGKHYTEPDVSRLLRQVYDDYGTIRRYLVDYGLLQRTPDGSEYWRNG